MKFKLISLTRPEFVLNLDPILVDSNRFDLNLRLIVMVLKLSAQKISVLVITKSYLTHSATPSKLRSLKKITLGTTITLSYNLSLWPRKKINFH